MKLILGDDLVAFKRLFTQINSTGPEVATKFISPSGLGCEVAVAFKLQGVEMLPEERSFESDGYASAGKDRHRTIQKFLKDHPEVEWVDIKQYVSDHNLPFDVEYEGIVKYLSEKYKLPEDDICEMIGSYERVLTHKNGLIRFKLDGLVKFRNQYYILEIKTVGSGKYKRAPLKEHQPQGSCYSMLLEVPRIIWVYENREDYKHIICMQEFQQEEIESIRNKLNRIVKYRNNPTNLSNLRGTDGCKNCRYKNHCDDIFKAEVVF